MPPQQRCNVSGRKGGAHHHAGIDVEIGTAADLSVFLVLDPVKLVFHHRSALKGLDQGLVLESLLDVALGPAFGLTDFAVEGTQSLEKHLAQKQEHRRNRKDRDSQAPVHDAEE